MVHIRVRVPARVGPGQEIEYKLCVHNSSTAAAHHVAVRNPIPAHARFVRAVPEPTSREPELVWQLGTLAGCACKEITLVLQPTGTGDVQNCARVQFEHGQCVTTRISRPALSIRKCGPAQAGLNETLTYRLEVRNTGEAEVSGVGVTDLLPAGLEHASGKDQLSWNLGTLGPGQARCLDYQVTARAPGRLCNRAVVTAPGGVTDQAEHCVTVAEASRLNLTKTGPKQQYVNIPATYQITVSNPSAVAATNVVVTDFLPAQTTFVSASPNGQQTGQQVEWAIGSLEPGASRTVEVTLRAQAGGEICNRASARADRGLTAQAEACTQFVGVSALLLEVIDKDDPIEVGAQTQYEIKVKNQGTIPATDVKIVATAPEQMAVIRASGPADNRKEGTQIIYNSITLQPGEEKIYTIHVQALRVGVVLFKVDLFARELTAGPVREEESTNIYSDQPGARLQPPQPRPPVPQPPGL